MDWQNHLYGVRFSEDIKADIETGFTSYLVGDSERDTRAMLASYPFTDGGDLDLNDILVQRRTDGSYGAFHHHGLAVMPLPQGCDMAEALRHAGGYYGEGVCPQGGARVIAILGETDLSGTAYLIEYEDYTEPHPYYGQPDFRLKPCAWTISL